MTLAADRAPEQPPTPRPSLGARVWTRWRTLPATAQVLLAYGGTRLVCALVIQVAATCCQNPAGVHDEHPDYLDMVGIWDGRWYREVATYGYPVPLPLGATGQITYNAWAFFPALPMLLRLAMSGGVPFSVAASVVNLAAGAVAAVLLHRLLLVRARSRTDRHLAVLGVALWGLMPAAPVLQVAYTEALAAALLAASLLLLVRRHYLWATLPVLALGLTRAIAAPLVAVLAVHLWHRWRDRREDPFGWSERVRLVVLGIAAGVSALLWPAIAGYVTGVPDAFLATQAAWGQQPARGLFVAWWDWAWSGAGVLGVLALVAVVAAYLWVVLGRHARWLVLELRAWAVIYPLYLLAVVRPITSMWRFMLLVLPIGALVGALLVRGRGEETLPGWGRRLAVVVGLTLAAMTWWTVSLLTYTPWSDSPP